MFFIIKNDDWQICKYGRRISSTNIRLLLHKFVFQNERKKIRENSKMHIWTGVSFHCIVE